MYLAQSTVVSFYLIDMQNNVPSWYGRFHPPLLMTSGDFPAAGTQFPAPCHMPWFLSSLRFGVGLLAFSISGASLRSWGLSTEDSGHLLSMRKVRERLGNFCLSLLLPSSVPTDGKEKFRA